jgi:mono/diheme cytochrome c family protein
MRAGAVLAAVATLLFDATMAQAEDLDAGKTGPKLFATNCASCHRTPKGLAKRNGWFLASFLQVHYTTNRASAGELAAYLTSLDRPAAGRPPRGAPPRRSATPAEQRREPILRPPVALAKPP